MPNGKQKQDKPMSWIKSLLNNVSLLKWVRKFSADNLCDDNSLAEGFGVKCNEESISVGDTTMTKLIVTQARYNGEEHSRFNFKQIAGLVQILGSEGELIIGKNDDKNMFLQIKDTVVIVSPLPKSDKKNGS